MYDTKQPYYNNQKVYFYGIYDTNKHTITIK